MSDTPAPSHHHRRRDPRRQRRVLAHRRPRRSDPAPGPLPDPEDGAVQPRACPRAGRARQRRRRPRLLRGDRGRHASGPRPTSSSNGQAHRRCSSASRPWPASWASADTVRDPRGFAIKFYTEEGNYDLVGNNTPVFFIRDPQKFQDFIHSQKRRADTGLRDQQHAVGLLDALARVGPSGDVPDDRPRHAAHLAQHERLRQPHLHCGSTRAASGSGSSTTSRPSRASRTSPTPRPRPWRAEDPDFHRARPVRAPSPRGEHPSWRLEMQIMPVRRGGRTTASTRST